MKISIITPVYKAEKFLRRCVESIIAQTYTNWELILIDDGSPDNCGLICDEYASKDHRVKVIHKRNEGVSAARQDGLDISTGEYVIHADSDDWLAPNMLEELIIYALRSYDDLIIFDFYRVNYNEKELIRQCPTNLDHNKVLNDIISGQIYACCWNKFIKRSVIAKYKASFPKRINLGEDKCFLASLLKNPLKIGYLPKALYNYDVSTNASSLVRRITKESVESGILMVRYLEKELPGDYQDSIFEVKKRLKIRAIKSQLFTQTECKRLFHEINKRIIIDVLCGRSFHRDDIKLLLHLFGLNLFVNKLR